MLPPINAQPVLVTGGAGYVGAHTCKALKKWGFLPVALDNLSCGNAAAVKWGPLEIGDIGDAAFLKELFAKYSFAAIIHFAAATYVGESMSDPIKYYKNNLAHTLTLLETALQKGGCPLIFSSTCATYGTPHKLPLTEEHPQNPINPYGFTKLATERMVADFHRAYGLPYIALRYFNAAGADEDGEIGESHDPAMHLIPIIFDALLGNRPPVEIFGSDYPTPDGTAIRDYVHVSDLAEAHVRALCYLLSGGKSDAFNLGSGIGYSVKEIIEAAAAVTESVIPIQYAPRRAGDPPILVADIAKSRAQLHWTPLRSDIHTLLRSAWEWHRRSHPASIR